MLGRIRWFEQQSDFRFPPAIVPARAVAGCRVAGRRAQMAEPTIFSRRGLAPTVAFGRSQPDNPPFGPAVATMREQPAA